MVNIWLSNTRKKWKNLLVNMPLTNSVENRPESASQNNLFRESEENSPLITKKGRINDYQILKKNEISLVKFAWSK